MYSKYFPRKQPMPVAIAVGMDPALWYLSCQTDVPWGTSEMDAAGFIKGEPLEVIKGEYTGLPLPGFLRERVANLRLILRDLPEAAKHDIGYRNAWRLLTGKPWQ